MRLISREVDAVLQKPVPVNFGLYFNKFLEYHQDFRYVEQRKKGGQEEKSSFKPLSGEISGRAPVNSPLKQFEDLYCRSKEQVNLGLRDRHLYQDAFCRSAKAGGYSVFIFHARLQSPYISGLGMAHPTETGMVLDHTLGVPYIPAAGQKGLLRLAYMLNDLRDDDGNWLPLEQFDCDKNGNLCWEEDDLSRTLFGFSDKKDALAGRLVILDAYPLSQPPLGEDIINPHYGEYYQSQGKNRGPTEDQNPVPVKFLVVKKGQEFVFRFLLRHGFQKAPSADIDALSAKIKTAMKTVLTEEGFGAKTALGYGRFEILGEDEEPDEVRQWRKDAVLQQQKREQERLARIELEKYPWRPLLRKIEKVDNWGDFKLKVVNNKWGKIFKELKLDVEKIDSFRKEKEFVEGVKNTALRLAQVNPKKWTEERDKLVADWFAPSPVSWESPFPQSQPETASVEPLENDLLRSINSLSSWSDYRKMGIKISSLDKSGAEALKEKFIKWACKKSKDRKQRKSYQQLVDRINKLS